MAEYLRQQFIHTRQTGYDITYNMKRAQTIHYLDFLFMWDLQSINFVN